MTEARVVPVSLCVDRTNDGGGREQRQVLSEQREGDRKRRGLTSCTRCIFKTQISPLPRSWPRPRFSRQNPERPNKLWEKIPMSHSLSRVKQVSCSQRCGNTVLEGMYERTLAWVIKTSIVTSEGIARFYQSCSSS